MKLSTQAIQVFKELKKEGSLSVEQLESQGFDQSMVHRAALEMEEKGLLEIQEDDKLVQSVTAKGKDVLENGSPEYRLIQELEDGSKEFGELNVNPEIAVGKAKQKGWIEIEEGEVFLTKEGRNVKQDDLKIALKNENFDEEMEDRGLYETDTVPERILVLTENGKETDEDGIEEQFDVESRVKTPRTGRKHFYREIQDYAKQVWLEMGFEEITGDYVVPSLLNFDALYTPQDHPAREMHDTFFMEKPAHVDLSDYSDISDRIKQTHEDGWTTGSTGWNYDWKNEEAAKNVLRTHTTAATVRRIHEIEINEEDLPKKFFILGRNFRNETVDRHHLAEFYQTDGIVVGEDLNFRNLKGYISEFFEKMGYEKFRMIPSYYPYTEMSVEVQVYDEQDGWIGLGGAGMFRPEVVKPMLGVEAKVLAWGLGIPRIAMKAADIDDIRELYRNDIKLLEQTPRWRPDS